MGGATAIFSLFCRRDFTLRYLAIPHNRKQLKQTPAQKHKKYIILLALRLHSNVFHCHITPEFPDHATPSKQLYSRAIASTKISYAVEIHNPSGLSLHQKSGYPVFGSKHGRLQFSAALPRKDLLLRLRSYAPIHPVNGRPENPRRKVAVHFLCLIFYIWYYSAYF